MFFFKSCLCIMFRANLWGTHGAVWGCERHHWGLGTPAEAKRLGTMVKDPHLGLGQKAFGGGYNGGWLLLPELGDWKSTVSRALGPP